MKVEKFAENGNERNFVQNPTENDKSFVKKSGNLYEIGSFVQNTAKSESNFVNNSPILNKNGGFVQNTDESGKGFVQNTDNLYKIGAGDNFVQNSTNSDRESSNFVQNSENGGKDGNFVQNAAKPDDSFVKNSDNLYKKGDILQNTPETDKSFVQNSGDLYKKDSFLQNTANSDEVFVKNSGDLYKNSNFVQNSTDNDGKDGNFVQNSPESEQTTPEEQMLLEKFKTVNKLVKAYARLQAEFTKRTKLLRAYEKGQIAPKDEVLLKFAQTSAAVRDAVIGEYLEGISKNHSVRLVGGGQIAAAPRTSPNSVREAGRLASEFLNK